MPLVASLLCISHKHFFLSNWVPFLNHALTLIRGKEPKYARIALEAILRLLWCVRSALSPPPPPLTRPSPLSSGLCTR